VATFFFVVFDLILLAVCVAFGEFPGFALWLVLTCVGIWVSRSQRLKAAEIELRAEEIRLRRRERDEESD